MFKENEAEFTKSNLLAWHKAGYVGKAVTIAILDDASFPLEQDKVELPLEKHNNTSKAHKRLVCSAYRQGLPEARIIGLNYFGDRERSVDWILQHQDEIDIINCSFSGAVGKENFERLESLDIPILCSSGNAGKHYISWPASLPWTIAVGAYEETLERKATYSQWGEGLDCLAYTALMVPNSKGGSMYFSGTSCSAPMAGILLGAYIDYRKQNGLPKLGREEARKFIHENCKDIMEEGFDLKSGHGLFILPDKIPEKEGETLELRKGQILFAVIHHSAKLNQYTAEEVLRVHKARGFATYGYNTLIERDGKVVAGRDRKYRGAHTYVEGATDPQYWNENSLGYCLVHNGEEKPFPDVMYKSLAKELKKDGFSAAQIRLHRELKATACPGKYFDKAKLLNYLEKEWEGAMAKTDYDSHWAKSDIDSVKKLGLMAGYDEQTFKPDQPVTRAELAAVINRLYNKLK